MIMGLKKMVNGDSKSILGGALFAIMLGLSAWGLSSVVEGIRVYAALTERTVQIEQDIKDMQKMLPNFATHDEISQQVDRLNATLTAESSRWRDRVASIEIKIDTRLDSIQRIIIDTINKSDRSK